MKTLALCMTLLVGCVAAQSTSATEQSTGTCVSDPVVRGIGGGGGQIVNHCPPPDPTIAATLATQDAAARASAQVGAFPPPDTELNVTCDDPSDSMGKCNTTFWVSLTHWINTGCFFYGVCAAALCSADPTTGAEVCIFLF